MIWTFFVAAVCLLCLAAVWRIERAGAALLITPFLWFMILEALLVWPAVIQENVTSGFDPYVLLLAAAAVLSFMLAYGGFLLAAKHRREDLAAFQQAPHTPLSERHVFFTLLTVAFLLALMGLFLFQGLPPLIVGIWRLIESGGAGEVAKFLGESRQEITKSHYFGGAYRGQGAIRTLMRVGWPFLFIVASIMARECRGLPKWSVLKWGIAIVGAAFIAGDGTRAPIVEAVLMVVVAYSLLGWLRMRSVAVTAAVIVLGVILLSAVTPKLSNAVGKDGFWSTAISSVGERVLFGNGEYTVIAVNLVREGVIAPRRGDIHLTELLNSIPGVQYGPPFSHELFLTLNPGSQRTTFYSMTYLAKAYADFGVVGVIAIYLLMGVIAGVTLRVLLRCKKDAFTIPLMALATYYVGRLTIIGLMGLPSALAVVLFVFGLIQGVYALSERWSDPRVGQLATRGGA